MRLSLYDGGIWPIVLGLLSNNKMRLSHKDEGIWPFAKALSLTIT
jgi:hypothetical protein